MALSQIFQIAGSAMTAQSVRLNTTASNMANVDSISSNRGETYRARHPVFSAVQTQVNNALGWEDNDGLAVKVNGIVESQAPLRQQYQPEHPMANEQGYIFLPNVNMVKEMADMMSASRTYQSNVEIYNTVKQLMTRTLAMGQ